MIICNTQRIIYLAPPKTGTGSIVGVLKQRPYRGVFQDYTQGYHNTIWEERFRDWFIFITTRHPYTRAVSYWQWVQRQVRIIKNNPTKNAVNCQFWARAYNYNIPSFTEFWDVFSHKHEQITTWRASWHLEQIPRPVDKIVYQERLLQEFTSIPAFAGRQLGRAHRNPPSKQPWHSYYTPELIARVHDHWGPDFAAFGYNPNFDDCVQGHYWVGNSIG